MLAQFTNLFALVLLAASVITFASYLVQSPRDAGNLELAVAILAVVVLNGAIGFFQEYSAEKTSEALQALVPHTARVRRDGALADIPARGIVRGDVFVLEAGDDICCDGRLVVPPMRTASCMTHAISHACERRVLSKCCSGPWQGAPRNLRWHGRARIFLMKRQCTLSMTAT